MIPRGLDNSIAINLMIKHIKNQLALKSRNHLQRLKKLGVNIKFDIDKFNIKLLQNTNQVKGSIRFYLIRQLHVMISYFILIVCVDY